jgi:alpha-beta hydrolase superfamily lysophospholipase
LVCDGVDSTKEELHFICATSLPEHGYAVLSVDGPGQGMSLLRDKTGQRPDWEVVVKAMLDFVSSRVRSTPELEATIDLERIA